MHSRSKKKIAQLLMLAPLLICTPIGVHAGFIKFWQLKETATAPVLVVGRIVDVQKKEHVPDGSLPWKAETWSMTAEVQVLRSYSASGQLITPDRLRVSFLAYGPSVTAFINGYPPPLPEFEAGRIMILPLRENKNPASELWQLTADSGVGLVIPARAEMPDSGSATVTARSFLIREVANTLSRGTPREVFSVAQYLSGQDVDLRPELMPLLEAAIGNDRKRWAEVATNMLAAQGVPRPSVADLFSSKAEPKDWPGRQNLFLAQLPLQKLKATPETDALLIQTWIREAPFHAWGSANSLLEFADNAATTEALRRALRDDIAGSSYIAWAFAHSGHPIVLADALERALKVADRPDADGTDLQGAAALLRDFGSDQQLKQLAGLVRKYQTADQKFYSTLWQYATEAGNPREARVLVVVLRDRRVVFGDTRYCDAAVYVLERAVGEHFGSGGKTDEERDAAVSQALVWLKSHGISD